MGIFTTLFYQPILNLFIGIYNILPGHDAGLVIIVITLIIRLVIYPLSRKQVVAQKEMQDLQPKMNEIRQKYANDKEGLARATMDLYKEHKVNPFSSCLPVLLQLPIFFAMFQVLRDGLTKPESFDLLYRFISRPEMIDPTFLGLINLAQPHVVLAVLAGAVQFWQGKMLFSKRPEASVRKDPGAKDEDTMAIMNKQMMYMMPVVFGIIGLTMPSGLSLYWIVSTLFTIAQQYIAFRGMKPSSTRIDEKTEVLAKESN